MGCGQCDQMSKLCFQYFAFYKIENMPNITKMYQNRINVLLNTNTPSENFETSPFLVTLVVAFFSLAHVMAVSDEQL